MSESSRVSRDYVEDHGSLTSPEPASVVLMKVVPDYGKVL